MFGGFSIRGIFLFRHHLWRSLHGGVRWARRGIIQLAGILLHVVHVPVVVVVGNCGRAHPAVHVGRGKVLHGRHALSVLKTPEEIKEDTKRILAGEETTTESVNRVTDVPREFKSWIAANEDRMMSAKSIPYFVRDNEKYFPQMRITDAAAKGVKEAQRLNDKLAQAAKESIDYDKFNDAMEQYVGGDGMWINQYLRDKSGFGELDGAEMEYLKELTDITSIENVGERVLYRSVDARAIFGNMTDIDFENLQSYYLYEGRDRYALAQADRASKLIGTERIEKGFMSTTKSLDIAADWSDYTGADYPVMMRIKTGANTKGFDVERYTKIHNPEIEIDSPQREMLLARGQKYKITNISKEGRNICVDVEFIDAKAAASAPKLSPLDIAKQRHAARTPEEVEAIQQAWDASRKEAHRQAILDAAKVRQAARTPEQTKAIKEAWDARKAAVIIGNKPIDSISEVQNVMNRFIKAYPEETNYKAITVGIYKQKSKKGSFSIMHANSPAGVIEFNNVCYPRLKYSPYTLLKTALDKIRKNVDLTFEEEYSIESFYHEILHCKAKQWEKLKPHYKGDYKRTAMETVNQFVSRHEYKGFIERLGGKALNQQQVLDNGIGYSNWVGRFRDFIKASGVKEADACSYLKGKLLSGKYGELDDVLANFIKQNSGDLLSAYSNDAILECLESGGDKWKFIIDLIKNKP